MYEIVLAGYNYVLENSNLGWIRASFFLNIPWVLCIFIYIRIMFKKNKLPSIGDFILIILLYVIFFFKYFIFCGCYGEIGELQEIRTVLNNSTAMALLTCSTGHYRRVFGIKIVNLSIVLLGVFISPCLIRFFNLCENRRNNEPKNYDRFISSVVNRWRNFLDILYQRHREEVVITYF